MGMWADGRVQVEVVPNRKLPVDFVMVLRSGEGTGCVLGLEEKGELVSGH